MSILRIGAALFVSTSAALTLAQQLPGSNWISAGSAGVLPQQMEFPTPTGKLGVILSSGPAKAKTVEITAQRAPTLLSNGKTLTESETIAAERAERVAELLRGLGTEAAPVRIRILPSVPKPDEISDSENRMVSIRVSP
jgi:hypothetical protein